MRSHQWHGKIKLYRILQSTEKKLTGYLCKFLKAHFVVCKKKKHIKVSKYK